MCGGKRNAAYEVHDEECPALQERELVKKLRDSIAPRVSDVSGCRIADGSDPGRTRAPGIDAAEDEAPDR